MRICLQTLAPNREIFKYFPFVSILTRLWVRMKDLQSVKMKRSNSVFSRDIEYLIKPWIYSIFFSVTLLYLFCPLLTIFTYISINNENKPKFPHWCVLHKNLNGKYVQNFDKLY